VLAVTGPHATADVMAAVHAHLPKLHDPFTDLVPPQGVKLTPRHYAYLKISEGCNHRCTFCIIPAMRGDLVSRPIGGGAGGGGTTVQSRRAGAPDRIAGHERLRCGRSLSHGFLEGRPLKTRMNELATALDTMARAHGAWVRLHYVYPYPHVDDVIGRMTSRAGIGRPPALSRRAVPACEPPHPQADEAPGERRGHVAAHRAWRAARPDLVIRSTFIAGFPGETEREFEELLAFLEAAELDRVGCFAYSPVDGAAANALPDPVPVEIREERRARFMAVQEKITRGGSRGASARR
jgi:ribosomal protein S12 methylthiotransferase